MHMAALHDSERLCLPARRCLVQHQRWLRAGAGDPLTLVVTDVSLVGQLSCSLTKAQVLRPVLQVEGSTELWEDLQASGSMLKAQKVRHAVLHPASHSRVR